MANQSFAEGTRDVTKIDSFAIPSRADTLLEAAKMKHMTT